MAVHTTIDERHLPVDLAEPNRITATYDSYVLIPHLGPLLYTRVYRRLRLLAADLAATIAWLGDVEAYAATYEEIPPTPYVPDDIDVSGPSVVEGTARARFEIDEAYARPNDRRPQELLRTLTDIGGPVIGTAPVASFYAPRDGRMQDYRAIVAAVAEPNRIVSAMTGSRQLFRDDGIVEPRFLAAGRAEQVGTLVDTFIGSTRVDDVRDGARALGESMVEVLVRDEVELADFQGDLAKVVTLPIARLLDVFEIDDPSDDVVIAESCEWAFLRKERVTLDLKQPLLRGPLSVESVAPASELTLTETESRTSTTGSRTLTQTTDDLRTYTSIQSEVANKLGTLFDYGSNLGQTMSEQGYTQDDMKSEKRSRVEAALRDLSRRNATATVSMRTLSESQIREYATEGKDPRHATSELSFEVFSPVEVRHHIDDVCAVWSPRAKNPFRDLRTHLDSYYWKVHADYVLENYVVDPSEPVPSYEKVNRVTRDTVHETSPGTYVKDVTFKLTETERSTGHVFGEDVQLEFHQHADWYENSYDEDDRWMKVVSTDRHGGDSWVDVRVKYHVDDVTGNDPDRTFIRVSIDKYKETEAYRKERKDYVQTTGRTNPARRNAVRAQARKYATLKRDELIRRYERDADRLKDYAFTSMIRQMFDDNAGDGDWSYYLGIIRTCIDWERTRLEVEPCDIDALYADVLSPYHFLNVQAVRFFLPINVGAESVFFDTMRKVVDPAWRSLFTTVEDYLADQRDQFRELAGEPPELDHYDAELVLGRHLEAVLSNTAFAEE